MGVATTAIFWITETAFWLIWGTDLAREAGAVLGLMVGYTPNTCSTGASSSPKSRGRHDGAFGMGPDAGGRVPRAPRAARRTWRAPWRKAR
jgi:hypothetical protein